ncbi:MAG: redoxin domain-containing protein [Bacteroidales bacterium]|jgi:hypothetical protein|nr:redoxin domain-containing protein [Bacteroidales bacterium]
MSVVRVVFVIFAISVGTFSLSAQTATITGNAPDYAGQTLILHCKDNLISDSEITPAECKVAANGEFKFEFQLSGTKLVWLYLGVFKARLLVEPDMNYRIKLPPRTDKTPEEAASPFFQEWQVYLHVLECTDANKNPVPPEEELNFCSIRFDEAYFPLHDSIAMNTMRNKTIRINPMMDSLKQRFPLTRNDYFNRYMTYRYGMLHYARQENIRTISNAFFSGKPVLYDNEAYMELFNLTYKDYFMYFGRSKEGNAIYDVINRRKSLSGLQHLLKADGTFAGDSLLEMVMIKNLYDEFYSDRFSRPALLTVLDSICEKSLIARHREISRQIRSKITRLLRGYAPPAFSLYNQDSVLVTPDSYKGKYVYLMFCTTQNYVCLSQYEILKELYRIHHQWLHIVVISADENFDDMREFRRKSGYLWDYLHFAGQPDVLKDYDVRIFPTCFFIDPEGKLATSPAPDAGNIDQLLYSELNGKGLWRQYIDQGLINRKYLEQRMKPRDGETGENSPPR